MTEMTNAQAALMAAATRYQGVFGLDTLKYAKQYLDWLDAQDSWEETPQDALPEPQPDPHPPSQNWKEGDRFIVPGYSGSYPDRSKDRYGTVVGFRPVPYIREHLVVRLDGEAEDHESFNPDVMRHLRTGEGP
jgi:hypothetical protein